MNRRSFLNLYAASAILGGLSFWPAALSSPPAEARAHQPESTRALDMPRMSGGARAVPPSGGDLRRPTAGKPSKRAGLTPRKDADSAQYRLTPRVNDLPESRVAGRRESAIAPSGGSAQGLPSSARSSSLSILSGRDGWAVMASAQGEREKGRPDSLRLPELRRWSSEIRQIRVGSSRPALRTLATNAADLCGVPAALFHSLIERESSWRPSVVSRSGAVGLAQVKPSTAREVSPTLDVSDPWQNLVAGACYLRRQFDRFGTWRSALHAYRLGPSAVVTRTAREYASDIIQGSAQ